jgi:hypothetical protein
VRDRLRRVRSPFNRLLISVVVWLLAHLPQRKIHWVGNQRSPRLLFLSLYVFILYTVVTTVILIAARNQQVAIYLFSAFVVPLYLVFMLPRRRKI